jgi:hypothetical protein
MAQFSYLEEQGDTSPTTASFSNASQSVSAVYLLKNPTFDQFRLSIVDILGYTDTRVGDGRIRRQLPLRHPAYPWCFADNYAPQGVGIDHTMVILTPGVGGPIIPAFPLYKQYHCRISFSPRQWNMWQDKDIKLVPGTYYPKNDTGTGPDPDNPRPGIAYKGAQEWLRFTTFDLYPMNNFITAQQGQMKFRASGLGGAAEPDGFTFQDSPRMYLPDNILKVRWQEVPYRYVTSENSYLAKFVGHINQNDFGFPDKNGVMRRFKKGSLLYLGANPTRIYTPPIPSEGVLTANFGDSFERSRLCDLELTFMATERTIGTASGNTPGFAAVNRNWVVGGWNLLPWLTTRKFYYATSYDPDDEGNQSKWFPSYSSFEYPLLFTDPDAAAATAPRLDP